MAEGGITVSADDVPELSGGEMETTSGISTLLEKESLTGPSDWSHTRKALTNIIVFKKLCGYLHLADLKYLRLTNSWFHDAVTDTLSFKEKVIVHINNSTLKDEVDFTCFLTMFPKWKSFAVTLLLDTKQPEVDTLSRLLPVVAESEMNHLRFSWDKWDDKDGTPASIFNSMISRTTLLTKLEISFAFLANVDFSNANDEIRHIWRNVADFTILVQSIQQINESLLKNLTFLETVLVHLKHFSVNKLTPSSSISSWIANIITPLLFSIMKNNCSTLESLNVMYPEFWNKANLDQIICPGLTRVSARCEESKDTILKTFLSKQPPLEEINISIKGHWDAATLGIIERQHAKTLKHLHIKANGLKLLDSIQDFDLDPSVFSKFTIIRDFALVIPQGEGNNGFIGTCNSQSIWENLPATTKKLKLRGLAVNPPRGISSLMNFPELSELCIIHFPRSYRFNWTDSGFADEIITKSKADGNFPFPNLTSLELTNFKINSENNLQGLSELKGLRRLRLSSCGLTDKAILKIKLPELKSLDISRNWSLLLPAIHQMIKQNPSLELLRCSQYNVQKAGRLVTVDYEPFFTEFLKHDVPDDSDLDAYAANNFEDDDDYDYYS